MRTVVRFIVALGVLALVGPLVAARAQQPLTGDIPVDGVLWKRLTGWTIAVDRTQNNACFIVSLARGPIVRIGYDDGRDFNLILTHDAWASLTPGRDYTMTIQLDDRRYPGTVKVTVRPDGRKFLARGFAADEGRQFLQAFQRGTRLNVIHEGRVLAGFSLAAARAAGEELQRCQAAMDKERPVPAAGAGLWKRVGGWQVRIDRAVGCEAHSLAAGPKLHLGYTERHELGLALTHDAWKSLEDGKDYLITLQIEDLQYAVEMKAWRVSNGRMGLRRIITDEAAGRQLLQDFQRGRSLSATYDGRPLATFALTNAPAVVEELRRCQASMPPPSGPVAPDEDPFKKR
mgnify:CR=1 FL=1